MTPCEDGEDEFELEDEEFEDPFEGYLVVFHSTEPLTLEDVEWWTTERYWVVFADETDAYIGPVAEPDLVDEANILANITKDVDKAVWHFVDWEIRQHFRDDDEVEQEDT